MTRPDGPTKMWDILFVQAREYARLITDGRISLLRDLCLKTPLKQEQRSSYLITHASTHILPLKTPVAIHLPTTAADTYIAAVGKSAF